MQKIKIINAVNVYVNNLCDEKKGFFYDND